MAAKFELRNSGSGQYMFNLKAPNGEVILTSELYKDKQSASSGILSVKTNSFEDARYERKTAKDGRSFFVMKAGNGQTIGTSEMYSSVTAMENGIQSVKKNAAVERTEDSTKA
jgi:uncharacterized protein YegP (UPF0339 family)